MYFTLKPRYIKITSILCSARSTVLVFEGSTKWLAEIKIYYFYENKTRVKVLNTAQFAEVYLMIAKFKNLVTLAFCTSFAILQEKGYHKI